MTSKVSDSNTATQYTFAYDAAGQLSSAVLNDSSNNLIHQYYYAYDNAGNRVSEQVDASVTKTTPNNLNQIAGQVAGGATRFQGIISQPGTVTVNGQRAQQATSTNFMANPVLASGTNTVTVVATNGNGAAQTNQYAVVIPSSGSISPSYDADGNMTNNGNGQTYQWDAENRLTQITIGSNTYQFAYDGLGRRISETDNGTAAKQWIWVGSTLAEERNGTDTSVTKRFFGQGEQVAGTNCYFTRDHLGSVREVTDGSGNIDARYAYDPYGRVTLVQGSNLADIQYAGYYEHQASGLNLTWFRAYDPNSARWLSRDPIHEEGGINLYGYSWNSPVDLVDPMGLNPGDILPSGAGIQFAGTVDVGIPTLNGMAMAGATGSLGLGDFYNSTTGQSSTGTFNSAGTFQHLPGAPLSNYPSSGGCRGGQTPFAAGAHAGFGPGVFLTNAGNVNDLSGPFNQYNVNLIGINISLGLSTDPNGNTTYILGASIPNPGLAASGYPTTTAVLSNSAARR